MGLLTSGSDRPQDSETLTFHASSGRVLGVLAMALAAVVIVLWVLDPDTVPAGLAAFALLGGVLAWSTMLWPRVWVNRDEVVLRNTFETIVIPLAAIESLVVRQVTAFRVGERRYVSPVVGRSLRSMVRPKQEVSATGVVSYPDHVEEALRRRCADARARAGIKPFSDEQEALAALVRRQLSWPVIAAYAVAGSLVLLAVLT